MTLFTFFFWFKRLSTWERVSFVFKINLPFSNKPLWQKPEVFFRRMSVQAKKSNFLVTTRHKPPERHNINVTTFTFFCQIIRVCMKNTCGPAIIRLMHAVFLHYSNHHEITLLRVRNQKLASPLSLKWSFNSWHNFGMRVVTWLWAVQCLLHQCQVTRKVPLIVVNYIYEEELIGLLIFRLLTRFIQGLHDR